MSNGAELAGRVVVVTGAAGGLGEASARVLSEHGMHVIAVDIDGEAVAALVETLPTDSIAIRADVGDEAAVSNYMAIGVERFGRIDAYHLNAGIFGTFDELPDIELVDFERVLRVNVTGQFLGLRAAFRQYRDQGSPGSVVITGSIAGLRGSADLLSYQTSKHAVTGLVRGGAMYGGPLGIRVNAVAPGIVPTALFASAATSMGGQDDMVTRAATTPLRRAGTATETAAVTLFLLSDASAYVTGQIISVDGGATIVNTVRPSGGAGAWDAAGMDAEFYNRPTPPKREETHG